MRRERRTRSESVHMLISFDVFKHVRLTAKLIAEQRRDKARRDGTRRGRGRGQYGNDGQRESTAAGRMSTNEERQRGERGLRTVETRERRID